MILTYHTRDSLFLFPVCDSFVYFSELNYQESRKCVKTAAISFCWLNSCAEIFLKINLETFVSLQSLNFWRTWKKIWWKLDWNWSLPDSVISKKTTWTSSSHREIWFTKRNRVYIKVQRPLYRWKMISSTENVVFVINAHLHLIKLQVWETKQES